MTRRLPFIVGGLFALALVTRGSPTAAQAVGTAAPGGPVAASTPGGPVAASAPTAGPAPSAAPRSEIYVPVGLSAFAGQSHLLVGLGGGIGYRYAASDRVSLYADARLGHYTGTIGTLTAGVTLGLQRRAWNPQLGLGGLLFLGDGVRILSSSQPSVPAKSAFALALRISPLRFVHGRLSGSALSTDLGCGLEPSGCVLALSVSILETGIRF